MCERLAESARQVVREVSLEAGRVQKTVKNAWKEEGEVTSSFRGRLVGTVLHILCDDPDWDQL